MLKKVRLKNFKLHEDTSIEASRITVFIGPNNSGKSSIFQALLALKQAARKFQTQSLTGLWSREETKAEQPYLYSQLDAPIIDLGDFENVARNPSRELMVGADVELPPEVSAADVVREAGSFSLSFDFWFRDDGLARHRGALACAYGRSQEWLWDREQREAARVGFPISEGESLILVPQATLDRPFQASVEFQPGPAPPGTSVKARELGETAGRLWARVLDSLRFVHQLRGFEEWGCPTTQFPAHERLDRLVLSDRVVALTNLLGANARLRRELSERLMTLVGIGIDFETASQRRVKVWATSVWGGKPVTLFVSEGSGANQLPFILVPIALAKPGETILLSEPEAHLHPKKQSELTAMLLEVSRKADLQFFIETHSEHVLHRLLHAVAKGELAHDDLTIYYFENIQGRAEVRKLVIDEKGGVEGGLPGFFDQSLDEQSEYLQALKEPKA
jgi:energy-coupling factor transporter ATP-binding protein EcfA2